MLKCYLNRRSSLVYTDNEMDSVVKEGSHKSKRLPFIDDTLQESPNYKSVKISW